MKGKITNYIEPKGFGFLLDEKGNKRFFHVSNVSNPLDIALGVLVEFEATENAKGLSAIKLAIISTPIQDKKKFINICGTRIKLSNIKQYGISSRSVTETYKIKHEADGFLENTADLLGFLTSGETIFSRTETKNEDKIIRYLYVKTYQGDNYTWDENETNINTVLKELDENM
ncbi:MAG: cold shock domain-containing protein [Smithellaceae bacterium]|jgi:cold shock CspA family protein